MNYYLKVLKQYSDFKGRARRKEYFMFALFNIIVSFFLGLVDGATGTIDEASGYGMLSAIYTAGVFIPSLAVAVRRMHDIGKSGWYILFPIYNLILVCTNGDSGDNEYGPSTKYDKNDELIN